MHIALLPNFDGESVFHLNIKRKAYRSINVLLEYIKGYGIDHHSRVIVDILPKCIEFY
jgi:hypothetical protein